jgi:hypothetical protein
MAETPTSQVDEPQFAQVLGILRQERQNYLLTRPQRVLFTLLNVFVYVFSLIWIPFILFLIIDKLMRPYWGPYWVNWGESIYQFLLPPMARLLGIAWFLAPILILLNLPLIYKIVKQKWRLRRLGLTETFRKHRQFRPRQKTSTQILMIIGGMAVFYGLMRNLLAKEKISLLGLMLLFVLGGVILGTYFLRLGKERLAFLAELASLEDSLKSSQLRARQTEAPGIEVPAEDLERVARIEQGQISRDRAEAIHSWRKSAGSAPPEYALLKSRKIMAELGELDLELRLRVEERIEQLSSDPHPRESLKDVRGDYWHLGISGTSLELRYAVDDKQRQIQLLAVQPLTDQVGPNSAPGDRDHA